MTPIARPLHNPCMRSILFLLLLFPAQGALAHDRHGFKADPLAEQLIEDLHEISHEHGQHPEVKNFVRRWVNNFNLVRNGRDLARWTQHKIQVQPALGEHVRNLALLFGASHAVESLSGPVGALIGHELGLSNAVNGAILAVGGVISIPGLDPICIILGAAYKLSPQFRVQTMKIRMLVQKASHVAARGLGLSKLASLFGHWRPGKDRLLALLEDGEMSLRFSGGRLTFETEGERVWLKEVQIENPDLFWEEWDQWKSKLDYNTRNAVDRLRLADKERPFYVTTKSSGDHHEILPGAIQPWGRWAWRGCDDLLKEP